MSSIKKVYKLQNVNSLDLQNGGAVPQPSGKPSVRPPPSQPLPSRPPLSRPTKGGSVGPRPGSRPSPVVKRGGSRRKSRSKRSSRRRH